MNDSYALIICDCETTGLSPIKNDVIEISMIRLTLNDKNEYDEEQKTWCLRPLDISTIEEEALAINKHELNDLLHNTQYGKDTYKEPSEVIIEIEKWIAEDGFSSVDSSQTFPFSLERNNRIIDTKELAILVDICNNRRRLRYDLSGLVKAFGVKKGKAHRAAEDTKMTADLFVKIVKAVRGALREHFGDAYLKDE